MNQVKLFAICLSATMREGKQSDWNLTNEVVSRSVAWQRLARGFRKLANLSADRPYRCKGGLSRASASIAALIFGDTTLRAPRSSRDLRTNAIRGRLTKRELAIGCDEL
jgi:hypothetical protein